jgi:hypothetical protein
VIQEKMAKGEAKILHAFADTGVESEVLSIYGDVVRIGIDPTKNPFSEVIQADATQPPINSHFDLSIWHPPCQKWSVATQGGGKGRETHPNLIPQAREQAKEISEYYIIENVPNAPLEDPIFLNGHMFGIPLKYERAFETNYNLPQPQKTVDHPSTTQWDTDRGTEGWAWIGNKRLWNNVKGYSYDWPSEPLKRSAVPRCYLNYLLRPLIDNWKDDESVTKKTNHSTMEEKGLLDY